MNVESRYPELSYDGRALRRRDCSQCSRTFWHVDESVKYCGAKECNDGVMVMHKADGTRRSWTVRDVDVQIRDFLKDVPYVRQVLNLRRSKVVIKNSSTNMNFLCAGVSAFETLLKPSEKKLQHYENKLLINTQFCYRFYDKQNVKVTNRHSTGFYMTGLHCFEGSTHRFDPDWKSKWVVTLTRFFIERLGLDLNQIYFHADSWNDGVRAGPSVEFFVNGIQIGNCVFTDTDLQNDCYLKHSFLDVGLGLQRIHSVISTEERPYFKNVILDHLRSFIIGINDRVYPSKVGIGYNIRKIGEVILKQYNSCFADLKPLIHQVIDDLYKDLNEKTFNEDLATEVNDVLLNELERCRNNLLIR